MASVASFGGLFSCKWCWIFLRCFLCCLELWSCDYRIRMSSLYFCLKLKWAISALVWMQEEKEETFITQNLIFFASVALLRSYTSLWVNSCVVVKAFQQHDFCEVTRVRCFDRRLFRCLFSRWWASTGILQIVRIQFKMLPHLFRLSLLKLFSFIFFYWRWFHNYCVNNICVVLCIVENWYKLENGRTFSLLIWCNYQKWSVWV